jgi:AAHS family 4-hydroxybenzoate transporter-like MFS transporter
LNVAVPGAVSRPASATDGQTVDVSAALDLAPFGPVQFTVLAFTFLSLITDGFDIQAIAFAAPPLTKLWAIERSALGPVFAAALFGMVAGAAGIGRLGDRYGRKTALVVSCALVAAGSLASAAATSPTDLAVYRLLTGIGIGGVLPSATALMFEFAPVAWRQIATAAALIGVPLGGMIGAALARSLIPEFGWRSLFVVGGAVPALLAVAMWPLLPESPRYLVVQRPRTGELAGLLNRMVHHASFDATAKFVTGGTTVAETGAVRAIFAREYRQETITLWVIFFSNVFSVYFFFNWLPTVLAAARLDFGLTVTGSLVFNLGGVLGALAGSMLIGRFGSRWVLASCGAGAVVSVALTGANAVFDANPAASGIAVLMWTMAAAGGCINAVQIGMFSVAANVYPTYCRSTGVGWALAVARFGGILSAFTGASFFALGLTARNFFFAIAGVLTVTMVGVLALRKHIPATHEPGRPLAARA